MTITVQLTPALSRNVPVFPSDTPITVSDRLLRERVKGRLLSELVGKEQRRQLHALVEEQVNRTIESLVAEVEKDKTERIRKDQRKREQVRHKRLEMARAASVKGAGKEIRPIIGRLSVLVAPGKKGEIIVREGEQTDQGLMRLVKNFVSCFGIQPQMTKVIFSNLKQLLAAKSRPTEPRSEETQKQAPEKVTASLGRSRSSQSRNSLLTKHNTVQEEVRTPALLPSSSPPTPYMESINLQFADTMQSLPAISAPAGAAQQPYLTTVDSASGKNPLSMMATSKHDSPTREFLAPRLLFKVRAGGGVIEVWDNSDLEQVAYQFCQDNGLDDGARGKVLNMIQSAYENHSQQ